MPHTLRFASAFLSVVFLACNVSHACADPDAQKSSVRFAGPESLVAKFGLQWTDLEAHIADRTDDPKAATVLTRMLLARKELIAGDLPRSRAALHEAMALAPTLPEAAYLHALLLYFAKDEQAESAFRKLYEQLPDNFHVRYYLALLLSESRGMNKRPISDGEQALTLARRNATLRPESITAQISLSYITLFCDSAGEGAVPHTFDEQCAAADIIGERLLVTDGRVSVERGDGQDSSALHRDGESALTLDDAYFLAKCLVAAPSKKFPHAMTAAAILLRTAVVTPGPFRNHNDAESMILTGNSGIRPTDIAPRPK